MVSVNICGVWVFCFKVLGVTAVDDSFMQNTQKTVVVVRNFRPSCIHGCKILYYYAVCIQMLTLL